MLRRDQHQHVKEQTIRMMAVRSSVEGTSLTANIADRPQEEQSGQMSQEHGVSRLMRLPMPKHLRVRTATAMYPWR